MFYVTHLDSAIYMNQLELSRRLTDKIENDGY